MSVIHKAETGAAARVLNGGAAHDHTDPVRVTIPASRLSQTSSVHLVRDGDVIQEIEINCACGERLRLICEYGQG